MAKIILNKNVNFKNGGRKAPAITTEVFMKKVNIFLKKFTDPDDEFEPDFFVDLLIENSRACYKDIEKIHDNFIENIVRLDDFYEEDFHDLKNQYLDDEYPLLVTESGVPYLLYGGGCDGGIPIVFMVYWDGFGFRIYIPTAGNTFNRKTKESISGCNDWDVDFIKGEGLTEWIVDEGYGDEISEDFWDNVIPGLDLCIKDFNSRLSVIG